MRSWSTNFLGQRRLVAASVFVVMMAVMGLIASPVPAILQAQTEDAVWVRVQATGTLRVGTAADYIPFAYRTSATEFDGYDVALIQAIGQELGLQVEITDIAFDGLLGALQLGQIDVAIAALSITPERSAVVDFTNVYYVGQDAVIAKPQSPIVVNTVEELASYRIGVQRGSVYEGWLRDTLVAPGKLAAEKLFVYGSTPSAVYDLRHGLIDLLVLDASSAEAYVQRGSVKLVVEGLNKQRFAMAVPKGANALREAINSTLSELQAEGRVVELAQRYLPLSASEVQPLPVASPTPTCLDGATLVDQNLATLPVVAPGQSFQKVWRIRNSGTCVWNNAYVLTYAGGNDPAAQMSGAPLPVQGTVASNQEYIFTLNLVAPLATGLYQGAWELHNSQGASFGERLWVAAQVPGPPTPAPTPTPASQSNIQFSADRTYVRAGECVNFYWRVENVSAVYFYALGEEAAGVGGVDQRTRCPTSTTTFELRVSAYDGSQIIRQITVSIDSAQTPQIRRFDLYPGGQVNLGQCVTVAWDVTGQVNYVRIRRNSQSLWDGAPLMGSFQDCPSQPGVADYLLEAQGPNGASSTHRTIVVAGP
ncbi:MAG: transporter substrate-binding domain-containing protein [Caldilineaceae bacterium]